MADGTETQMADRERGAATWKLVIVGGTAVACVCLATLAILSTGPGVQERDPAGGYAAGVREEVGVDVHRPAAGVPSRMPPDAAWRRVDDEGLVQRTLVPPRPEEKAGAVLVELAEGLGERRKGDAMVVSVPQTGESFRTIIERVESLIGTSRTFTARTDEGEPVSLVVTVAPISTFAWISTSSGAFELTGNARFAWIGPASGLREHFAEGRPDVMVLEEYP